MAHYQIPFSVVDQKGQAYHLKQYIDEGTYGEVYLDSTGNYLIKIFKPEVLETPSAQARIMFQLRGVRSLALDNLPIARPLELLRPPYVGYVMPYLKDMHQIRKLIFPPKGVNFSEWYNIQTGGLRRRMQILFRLANILNKLHNKGLVYADLSDKNVFISIQKANQVFLIDADNLAFKSGIEKRAIFTKKYAPPEILAGSSPNNSLTDAYSFAVMAFRVLSLAHPLFGDYVEDGDENLMDQALLGKIPWIYHSKNDLNRSSTGLSKEMVFSKDIFQLFEQVFEVTLLDPQKRPSVSQWQQSIFTAGQRIIDCPYCGASYYISLLACPWCDKKRPAFMKISSRLFYLTKEGFRPVPGSTAVFCLPIPSKKLVTYSTLGYFDDESNIVIFEVTVDQAKLFIRNSGNSEILLSPQDWLPTRDSKEGQPKAVNEVGTPIGCKTNWLLHINPNKDPHTILQFTLVAAIE